MTKPKEYPMDSAWKALLIALGVEPSNVLRRAGLPEALLLEDKPGLSTEEYFRFWRSLEEEVNDPLFPIRLNEAISPEFFSPPLFAALCSQHMLAASKRLSTYKRLIAPVKLHVNESEEHMELAVEWLDTTREPPVSYAATELVFFVRLARIATREPVQAQRVVMVTPPPMPEAYRDFFGVSIEQGNKHAVTFSKQDAMRPFLTANKAMWEIFEPTLRQRLSELQTSTSTSERVRAVLLEALPSGSGSIDSVSKRLAIGKRTLQRRLKNEGLSFQELLNRTREELARHYLTKTAISNVEISFLLGFEEPSSFFRAFHNWTGETPDQVRRARLH